MMAVGGLIAVPFGAATALYLYIAITSLRFGDRSHLSVVDQFSAVYAPYVLVGALVIGGIPTALGVWLFLSGLKRERRTGQL